MCQKKSLGETSLSAAFQAKADQSAHFVHQGMAITDQIHDTLSKTRQHKLEELYASTRRLQEMFDVTDEKYNRLMAFCSHIEKIQARLRLVRAAKEKKYPRHLKFQKILVNSLTSVVNGRKRYDDTNIEATHSNIYLNLPDWEPIAPFAPKAGPEAESSTSSRIPLDQQSRNTKIGNIAEGKP
eukprot:INCI12760.1.p1 GENE.INCI12760.1~~INCI12760.1.p1  ORF type:complete len:183 (-),score=30.87 INCI12760.1:359-907(-)